MDKWLPAAVDYIERWLDYQMRQSEQPGCVVAIVHRGKLLLERAYGHADLSAGTPLMPRHRFRVASHSKSFTAAGILKLRERGKLHLDDAVGRYVRHLHPAVAQSTIAQLLSHSAGIIRDGLDAGQWDERRPFLSPRELRSALKTAPVIAANTRFKYSNHGYGLAGLLIEAVTSEDYGAWIEREIVAPAGLKETTPDMPVAPRAPMASGHSAKLPVGRRLVIGGHNPTHALAPATGFVSTARDLLRFFAQLDPAARRSVLSVASRREMVRRQWRDPHASLERHYGLGIISGGRDEWEWFGHSGGFPGFITRTAVLPERGLAICVLTNAIDGPAAAWVDGAIAILRAFAERGAPARVVRDWTGRWWSRWWGAVDLVPMGSKVLVAAPDAGDPFQDASEIAVTGRDRGRIAVANGYAHHGEPVTRKRGRNGAVAEVWLTGTRFLPEASIVAELEKRRAGQADDPRSPVGHVV
jgi:CubicO group peptidase (beta-lactamase class C family)